MGPQNGNILFLILLAIILFAALAYAVNSGMRGGGKNASAEKAQLNQAVMENYEAAITTGLMRLKSTNGCKDAQISWETPSGQNANPDAPANKSCHLFHPSGAGVPYVGFGGNCTVPQLQSLALGESCQGLYYVATSGGNRLYTTQYDNGAVTWSGSATLTNANDPADGLANTNALVTLNDGGGPYNAVQSCRALGALWYLPASNELMAIGANKASVPNLDYGTGFGYGVYWTSTEQNGVNANANTVDMRNTPPTLSARPKTNPQVWRVRCVRRES